MLIASAIPGRRGARRLGSVAFTLAVMVGAPWALAQRPLAQELRSALARAPHPNVRVGACVVDLSTGRTVLTEGADTPLVPASAMKVFTMAAALSVLGPAFSFETVLATDGVDLYLLRASNGTEFFRFDPATNRYQPRAPAPESIWDGGDLEYGAGRFFATVGVAFDRNNGSGKGSKLYAYDPVANSWTPRAPTMIDGDLVANEALAYDAMNNRFYATMVEILNGGDDSLKRKLAIYDPGVDAWLGVTSAAGDEFGAASEAAYLDGKVYVWRGLLNGGAVNGSDSYLNVYDIAGDTWSHSPTLQDFGVIPGFRSGAQDIWGVAMAVDAARGLLFIIGCEANSQVFVFDAAGNLIGHILQGRDVVREAAAGRAIDPELLLRLEHVIVSHQRLPEWGSPKPPMTPEALIVHYADDLDAKYHMMVAILRDDAGSGPLTSRKNVLGQKVYRGGSAATDL